ncbi:unnamed protein product [Brassica rapa]|uniref:Transketolase N-terminal domain-containing protein n=2 Tax=Brassica TaxID=3705 RepID=A0A8D9HEY7_BRACM|nr:unnamed protein product [Brassica napus]CAG7897965.1 unnamed protein product [Brassica rapa]
MELALQIKASVSKYPVCDRRWLSDGGHCDAFTENLDQRFEALGWHVIWVKNGNTGYDEIRSAIKEAKAVTDKLTLIKVTTTIGYGSPNKANSYSVHGACVYITNTLDL